MKISYIGVFSAAILLSGITYGADDKPKSFFPKALDLSVPRLAAISLLGLDPSKAGSPTSVNSFVTDYVRGRDLNGVLEEGIAFGWSFQKLGLGTSIRASDIDNILDSKDAGQSARRLEAARLTNTPMLSFAALKADQGYTRAAISLSIALIDKSDWRYDVKGHEKLFKEFRSLAATAANGQVHTYTPTPLDSDEFIRAQMEDIKGQAFVKGPLSQQIDEVLGKQPIDRERLNAVLDDVVKAKQAKLEEEATEKADEATKEENDASKNNERLVVAFAGSALQKDCNSGGQWDGSYAWLSYERPMLGGGITLFTKGFQHDTRYDADTKTFNSSDGYDLGARFRSGGKSATSSLFAEGLYSVKKAGETTISRTLQIGYEAKVGDQWLQVGFGPSFTEGKTVTIFGLNLKWNFDTKPALVKSDASVSNTLVISAR